MVKIAWERKIYHTPNFRTLVISVLLLKWGTRRAREGLTMSRDDALRSATRERSSGGRRVSERGGGSRLYSSRRLFCRWFQLPDDEPIGQQAGHQE